MREKRGDVVVVRVSEQGDREDENFHSPKAQLAKARLWSEDQGDVDHAYTVRARLGDGGESNGIGPDDVDKPREHAKRLAAWRRLITDTVESATVAPAMTADGRPSRLWDRRRIDIRFPGQHP